MPIQDPQQITINGINYEFVPAVVERVDFFGESKEKLFKVYCKIMGAHGSQTPYDIIEARPIDSNIKNVPIKGELVFVRKGPTAYNSARATAQEYYYTNPIPVQSSVHHNGLPGVTDFLTKHQIGSVGARTNAEVGVMNKVKNRLNVNKTIDPTFPERLDVYPLQVYSGDILFEGRWGQSIRFGSTVDERRKYPQAPLWKKGLGQTGNPITIISNGTNPKGKAFNQFVIEDPDNDDSGIWLTSGQYVKFTPASKTTPSISSKSIDLFMKNQYGGNQIFLTSDRIIFNAKKQEIIGFSKEGIGFSSEKGISLDGAQVVELESKKISLGLDALSPALLGDRTINWLAQLCDLLSDVLAAIESQTHPTGTGPSGVPINVAQFSTAKSKLKAHRGKLDKLPSKLVFLNEKAGGPSEGEKEKAKNKKSTSYIEEYHNSQYGDSPDTFVVVPAVLDDADIGQQIGELGNIAEVQVDILESIGKSFSEDLTPDRIFNNAEGTNPNQSDGGLFGSLGG
jgi:hypothetical protein